MTTPKRYAEGTAVPAEQSRHEIETMLIKHGASGFLSGWTGNRAFIQFMLHGRMLRYAVERPEPEDFKDAVKRQWKWTDQQYAEQLARKAEAEHRRRWRALLLILKAKLEMVAGGDTTFDREFLADIMLPEGGTVGDQLLPQVEQAYLTGEMPKLLGSGS